MCRKMLVLLITCVSIHQIQQCSREILLQQVKLVKTPISANYFNVSKVKLTQFNKLNFGLDMVFVLFFKLDENVLVDLNVFKKRAKSQDILTLIYKFKQMPFPKAISNLHNILKPAIDAFQGHTNLPPFQIGKPFILEEVW